MADVTITPLNDGPYVVKGPAKLVDPGGNEFQVKGTAIALCRCGHSNNKPFCDGSHTKAGFKSATSAKTVKQG